MKINSPDNTYSPAVYAEQIRMLFRNQPQLTINASFIAIILSGALFNSVNRTLLLSWLSLILCINIVRNSLLSRFIKSNPDDETLLKRKSHLIYHSLVPGILWATFPLLITSSANPENFFIIYCILLGMCVGLMAPGTSMQGIVMGFAGPVCLSLLASLFIMSNSGLSFFNLPIHISLGSFLIIFLPTIYSVSGRSEKSLLESIHIRFERQRLIDELSAQKREIEATNKELNIQKQEAERANIAKSRFLAAASHDLRQPLHALELYLGTLSNELDTEKQHMLAKKMGVAIEATEDLFQRLLDISKLDAGTVEPNIEDCSAEDIFKRLEIRFTPMAQAKNLILTTSYENVAMLTDPVLLDRILDNLVSNAVRYTETGHIDITSKSEGDHIIIAVKDTGPGISSTEVDNIFSEFYQLHNPERDRTKGLGLGLSIVRRLCSLLGHKIDVTSELGQGSIFRVIVPIGQMNKVIANQQKPATMSWDLTGTKILVIDDEANIRDAMNELFSSWGCNVLTADSPDQAIHLLENDSPPAIIIADYRLRESKTGVEAIDEINTALDSKIPAILVTGDTAPERLQEAAKSNFILLHKPVNPAQIRRVVNRLLREKKS